MQQKAHSRMFIERLIYNRKNEHNSNIQGQKLLLKIFVYLQTREFYSDIGHHTEAHMDEP